MSDNEIINIFYTSKSKINPHLTNETYLNNHLDIKNYLESRYNDSLSIQETLYRIKNNIEVRPACMVCGRSVKFVSGNIGFRETCSVSCAKRLTHVTSDITDYHIILDDIINNGVLNNNKLQEKYLKEHGYYNFLMSIYLDSISISEKIYRLYYDIKEIPYCSECRKQLNYKNFIIGYGNFCNDICFEKYQYRNKDINDNDIISLLFNNNEPIFSRFEKEYLIAFHIYDYILNRFNDSDSITETVYRIKNQIYEKPSCKICGNKLKFIKYSIGFKDTCSIDCKYKLIEETSNNIDDQYIKDNFLINDTNIKNGICAQDKILKLKGVYNYLQNRFENCSIKEAIYRIKYNIKEAPKCPICGKQLLFKNLYDGYQKFCSTACTLKQKTIDKYKDLGYDIEIHNNIILVKNACKKHIEFELGTQAFYRRLQNNEELCPVCNPHRTTSIEDKIIKLLNKHNIKYYIHDIKHIYPLELDLFLSEYNIGIECNGIYWHSDYNIEKDQQRNKLDICKSKNIKLLTFWEDDIANNIDKIESILLSVCGLNKRIYARKCVVREIDSKASREFIDKNHLQGNINASIRLGLFYNNDLVEVMTFGKTRKPLGGKQLDNEYELYRLCSLSGYTIIGGASKLLKYFKDNYKWNKIISYCQNDISDGNVYEKIGFQFDKDCGLSFCYYDKYGNKINRFSLRKTNVDDGSGRTADEIVKSLGYLKCWNSGNKKYVLYNKGCQTNIF